MDRCLSHASATARPLPCALHQPKQIIVARSSRQPEMPSLAGWQLSGQQLQASSILRHHTGEHYRLLSCSTRYVLSSIMQAETQQDTRQLLQIASGTSTLFLHVL